MDIHWGYTQGKKLRNYGLQKLILNILKILFPMNEANVFQDTGIKGWIAGCELCGWWEHTGNGRRQ